MNLRCMYCQAMFAISRDEMLFALQSMSAENWSHYEAHCPKCRRANRIERSKLERANPNWQETTKAKKETAPSETNKKPAAATKSKAAPKARRKTIDSNEKKPSTAKSPTKKSEPKSKAK